MRTENIDKFILSQTLKLPDDKFSEYVTELTKKGLRRGQKPESYIRLFYVLRKSVFSNNYHQHFAVDFGELSYLNNTQRFGICIPTLMVQQNKNLNYGDFIGKQQLQLSAVITTVMPLILIKESSLSLNITAII